MTDPIKVVITGQDGVSKTFVAIAKNAETTGEALSKAGKDGAEGMDQLGKSAEQSASRMEDLNKSAKAIGAVIGTVASGLALAGHAYRDQERTIDGITRAYGDQSDAILQMTEDLQDYTRYSNDAGREAALLASSLAVNYDLSAEQIGQLIERSADLAQIYGITLPDAVQRTSSALRGEGESAELLSLNMSDAAIAAKALEAGIVGWNVPGALSEAEKAAFRFTILMEQSQYATGAAADAAVGAGGGFRQFTNEAQDMVTTVGGALGPVADLAAELQGVALWLPIAGAGMGRIIGPLKESGLLAAALRSPLASIGPTALVASYGLTQMIGNIQDLESGRDTLDRLNEELKLKGLVDGQLLLQDFRDEYNSIVKDIYDSGGFLASGVAVPNSVQAEFTRVLGEAFTNAEIDAQAFFDWFTTESERIRATGDQMALSQFIGGIDMSTLDQFKVDVNAVEAEMRAARATAEDFKTTMGDLGETLEGLRIGGDVRLANDLDSLHTSILEAFTPSEREVAAANATYLRMLPADDAEAALQSMVNKTDLSVESTERLGEAWERISTGLQTGALDNAAVIGDIQAILDDTTLSADEQAAAIDILSRSMSQYVDSAAAMHEAQLEFLADGANLLDFWQQYDAAINQGGASFDGTAAQLAELNARMAEQQQFRGMVQWAEDIAQAGAELDQVLRTFGEIDALGQRSESAGSIADTLIGAPGELGEIQDLWDRITVGTSDATLSQEAYNDAINAGIAIQESNVRVQDDLNAIRAQQLPLLAEEQQSYEANLEYLSQLEPAEQRRALLLQDTAAQAQIAELYSTAYAASVGKIPESVATEMILNAAEADAGIKDLLLSLGLLTEDEHGIRVNFPDADATVNAIDRVTLAILNMQAFAQDTTTLDLAIKLYGEDEALELLGLVKNADGTYAEAELAVQTTGLDEAMAGLKEVQLADGTMVRVKTEVDTSGWDELTAAELSAKFDNDPVKLPVEAVVKPMDGISSDEWNAMLGPFPEINVPVSLKFETGTGWVGDKLSEALGVVSETITVTADTSQADEAIATTHDNVTALNGESATVSVEGDNSAALGSIHDAEGALSNVDGTSATMVVNGDNSHALAAIADVQAYDGVSLGEAYFTITTRQITEFASRDLGRLTARHGGIPGYAHGGIPVELAEAGPELLHFATGGVTPVYERGIYTVPPNTYVSPANANSGVSHSGITVHFNGNFYGSNRQELNDWAEQSLIPNFRRVIEEERRGQLSG